MENQPLFSIIIPTYNRAALLRQAIQSVLDQTFSDWELLIIDDGSTDDTKAIVQSFQDAKIRYYFQKNKDRSIARNLGIEKAAGAYICFMDDDDYYLADYLQGFYDHLSAHNFPKTILRTGYYKVFDNQSKKKTVNYDAQLHKNPVSFSAFNMCGVWSLCIPKPFLKSEKFPIDFPHWQDTHLILRLLAKHPFHQLDTHAYAYRIHQQMGSIHLFDKNSFTQRMTLNLDAIRDLFDRYDSLVAEFLPSNTKYFLLAEKQLQYAIRAIRILGRMESLKLFYQSISMKFSLKFWKAYVSYVLNLIKSILS